MIRIGAAAFLAAALAGSGAAWAQDEDDERQGAEDEDDPCADVPGVPCGDNGDGGGDGGDETGSAGGDQEEDEGAASVSAGKAEAAVEAGAAMGRTLPAGKIAITAALQIGFSSELGGGEAGTPLSIAPDVWYGVNDKLSAGVVTSIYGQTGFWAGQIGDVGTGFCLSDAPGTDGVAAGCNGTFDNLGIEGLYALKSDESLGLAVDVGLHALSFDPNLLDVKVGAKGMWRHGRIGVGFAPSLFIALTERGDEGGNDDQLLFPVELTFMLTSRLHAGVQSGIAGSLQSFGEDYVVPLAFGGIFMINEKIMVAGAFSLDRMAGGSPEGVDDPRGTADERSVSLMFGYMM